MKILFVTPILGYPPIGGPELRIANSIKVLNKISDLHIINTSFSTNNLSAKAHRHYKKIFDNYFFIFDFKNKKFFFFLKLVSKFLEKFISVFPMFVFLDIANIIRGEFILRHVRNYKIQILWHGYGNISFPLLYYLKKRNSNLKIICDTDSVWSRFILRQKPYTASLRSFYTGLKGKLKKIEEKKFTNICDVITAVSEVDMKYYKAISRNDSKIHIFSNVIDKKNYNKTYNCNKSYKKFSIFFSGSFGHINSPVDRAAMWLVKEIFPIVLKKKPLLHLYIVGKNSKNCFKNFYHKNITVIDKVKSILPYLQNTKVALVPLMFESGTRFKILEAGISRIPIVSTTLGAEGIEVKKDHNIKIANNAIDFADAILDLLENKSLRNKISKNCYNLIEKKYTIDNAVYQARNILKYLL